MTINDLGGQTHTSYVACVSNINIPAKTASLCDLVKVWPQMTSDDLWCPLMTINDIGSHNQISYVASVDLMSIYSNIQSLSDVIIVWNWITYVWPPVTPVIYQILKIEQF